MPGFFKQTELGGSGHPKEGGADRSPEAVRSGLIDLAEFNVSRELAMGAVAQDETVAPIEVGYDQFAAEINALADAEIEREFAALDAQQSRAVSAEPVLAAANVQRPGAQ